METVAVKMIKICLGEIKALKILMVFVGSKSGKTFGFGLQIIIAIVCRIIEIPIAVISGANLGAFLNGR
tara:strand:+ start:426 stop:632 length:207 start_codon:yes stop_codon:yes gene_type:complete